MGHALGHTYDWDSMPLHYFDEDYKPIYSNQEAPSGVCTLRMWNSIDSLEIELVL